MPSKHLEIHINHSKFHKKQRFFLVYKGAAQENFAKRRIRAQIIDIFTAILPILLPFAGYYHGYSDNIYEISTIDEADMHALTVFRPAYGHGGRATQTRRATRPLAASAGTWLLHSFHLAVPFGQLIAVHGINKSTQRLPYCGRSTGCFLIFSV